MTRPSSPEYTREDAQITVTVSGVDHIAWHTADVSRDLESLAGTFSLQVSLQAGRSPDIKRGDEVLVKIGSTQVLRGYALVADPFYNRRDVGLVVAGRSRTGDLIKCSALHAGGQWHNAKLDRICTDLITPYGLSLDVQEPVGAPIPTFKLAEGETVLDALSRAAKLRGLLVSGDALGRLVLGKAGSKRFGGAIIRGKNVIDCQPVGSDEDLHSEYIVRGGGGGGLITSLEEFDRARPATLTVRATDDTVKRYLPLVIEPEGNAGRAELQALVEHTMRVRRGHALGYRYTVEGWTWQGQAWPVNALVPIYDDVVGLAGTEWLICSVRSRCTLEDGDVTELVVRPREAYDRVPLKSKPKRKDFDGKGPSDGASSSKGGQ